MRSPHRGPRSTNPPGAAESTARQSIRRHRRDVTHRFQALVQLAPDATVVVDARGHIRLVNSQTEELFGYSADELLGQPVEMLIPERLRAIHQQHREEYARVPRVRPMGAQIGLSGRRRDGTEFPLEASLGPLVEGGESLVIVSIRDITEQQQVRALLALTDTALSHLTLDSLLDELMARVVDVMGVDEAAILLLTETSEGKILALQAAHGCDDTENVRVPVGQGFVGRIAASRAPLAVDDLSTFPVYAPALHRRLSSAVGVPLLVEDRLLGVVQARTLLPHHFTPHDVQLLQQAADRIALVIDRARLFGQEQQARERAEAAQVRAEVALAQAQVSENRYRRLVEANVVGIVVGDSERVLESNDAFLQMVGYTQADVEAGLLSLDILSPPDIRALSRHAVREALATGASAPFEREYVRKDGRRVSALVGMALLQRDPVRFVHFALDLTEQKRLEQEHTEQAEQLNRIFEHISDGLVVYNTQGQPVRLNTAARRILGLDAAPSEYNQLPTFNRAILYEAYDEQGRRLAPEDWPLIRVLSGQVTGADTREIRLRVLNGREVEVISSAAPMRDGDGQLVGAVTILHDQTEQKRLAREREEARAHELALEDTARHMDEFLATASHELRTPLAVLKSHVQIALRRCRRLREGAAAHLDALPDADIMALHASLAEANQSADRLTRLVAVLFDVARAHSGVLDLQLAPCDLAVLVHRTAAAHQAAVPERRIVLNVPEAAVPVEADADRLAQVLSNFLTNALKYSAADQPVTVKLDVAENWAVVSVVDRGPGLPPEERSRVWELFHRVPGIKVQSANNDASGSLGLGLHICKQLVELHPGGQVSVESAVGEGSTFWFRLPLVS